MNTADVVQLDRYNDEYVITTGLTLAQSDQRGDNELAAVRPTELFTSSVRPWLAVGSRRQRFGSEPELNAMEQQLLMAA